MGSDADKAHNVSLDDSPSKPSFFSRLTSPLRSRTRNLADFHIRLQEPHRNYSAGDHVRGHVILSVVKPIRITHLTVALHGFVRVYKHAGAGAQLSPVNPAVISHDKNRNVRYFGNGLASLFQDEQVLCGEGRLKPTRFEFEFDLIFPSKGLPSSIDFERGTISYMITATLTRPTSIAATSSCETKVALVEKVDIGLLVPPRERKVCMQTLRRRPKKKKKLVPTVSTVKHGSLSEEPASDLDSTRVNENSTGSSASLGEIVAAGPSGSNLPRSPLRSDMIPGDLQSEISGESALSNNSGSNSARGADASGESVAASRMSGSDEREINATVELLKGGCLPGDILPVKIRVEHNRRMKSMHGVIVTLYRQGRVDYSPPISLFTTDLSQEEAKRLEREDYYPRSRTGLGGLSLSSAGSCSVFRKDLSQAVTPLIIDPTTLTANITTSVRVPEDVFPSIRNVPGGLISFKYHVEVILDLGGKLAGQSGSSQQTSRMGSLGVPGGNPASTIGAYDIKRLANWNGTIVDTDHLRREKGVISVSFEVVVGTTDSTRSQGKSVVRPALTVEPPSTEDANGENDESNYTWQHEYDDEHNYHGDYAPGQLEPSPQSYFPPGASPQTSYYDFQDREAHAPVYIPPPDLPSENGLSEKERVRQAEQRLLPSQPPQLPSESEAGPSQPSAPSDISVFPTNVIGPSNGHISLPALEEDIGEGPSAPTLADLTPTGPPRGPNEDKRELERQRLLQEASAPPEVPDDFDAEGPSAPSLDHPGVLEPTAPILNDSHEYGAPDPYHEIAGPSHQSTGHEPLPRYER